MANHSGLRRKSIPKPNQADGELEGILRRIRESRNFDFRSYKRATLYRRIQRRMQDRRLKRVADYSKFLDQHPTEYDALLTSMFIKATSFFRDPESWDALSTKVIPQMLADRRPGEPIRVDAEIEEAAGEEPRHIGFGRCQLGAMGQEARALQ